MEAAKTQNKDRRGVDPEAPTNQQFPHTMMLITKQNMKRTVQNTTITIFAAVDVFRYI
jgi:hypothetical protein